MAVSLLCGVGACPWLVYLGSISSGIGIYRFYAVYDGHEGSRAADHVRLHLHLELAQELDRAFRCASTQLILAYKRGLTMLSIRSGRNLVFRAELGWAESPGLTFSPCGR